MSYIYLILEREFIKTNENIYKIGRSNQNNDKRIKQYPNNSKLILQTICSDCHFSENKIISLFKTKYIHRNDIGHEYFEGDVFEMRKDINKIIDEFDKLSIDELQKRAKEQLIENKLNKDLEKQILLQKKQEEIEILNKKKENIKKELLEELEYIERKKNELIKKKEEKYNNYQLKLNKKTFKNEKIVNSIADKLKKNIDSSEDINYNKKEDENILQNNKDFLAEFIDNNINFINGNYIRRNIFREKYNYWCKENQYPEDNSSDKKFSRKLTKKGIKNSSSHGIRIYTNIIFKN
jgi:hypothetical protein